MKKQTRWIPPVLFGVTGLTLLVLTLLLPHPEKITFDERAKASIFPTTHAPK